MVSETSSLKGSALCRFVAVAALTAGIGVFSAPALAQQQAGVSAAVRGQVALARPSANIVGRKVETGEKIYLGDAITSGRDSGLQIMLLDETVFSIGPNSEIAIDKFVYDPSTGSGNVTASVAKGVFRFITGKIAQNRPEDMTVRLPTATIGIRGTIVAGAVRTQAGSDAAVDKLFSDLKGTVPDAENARDFVVLLGPGNENNTNDHGGAFVFTPNPPQRAESETGLNAGAAPPPGSIAIGDGVVVSRTGSGVVGYQTGVISEPFVAPPNAAQGLGILTAAQPPGGPAGNPDDADAQETTSTPASAADTLSGNTLAEAAADATVQAALTTLAESNGDIVDPTAGAGGSGTSFLTTLAEVTAITTGSALYNIGTTPIIGTASGSYSGTVTLDFASQQLSTDISGDYSGALNAFFSLSSTETFSQAATNGFMSGSFDSAVDSEIGIDGDGRVIVSGTFINDANGTAGSLVHSVTVIDTVDGQVKGTGAGLTPKQ